MNFRVLHVIPDICEEHFHFLGPPAETVGEEGHTQTRKISCCSFVGPKTFRPQKFSFSRVLHDNKFLNNAMQSNPTQI